MRRQKNMFQSKEQDKTSGKELNKTEISNLSDKEFKVMVIRLLTEPGRRMDELQQTDRKYKKVPNRSYN